MIEVPNTAAAEMEQAEGRLVAEAAATRNLGEDANAAAAHNLGEDANITAAKNLGEHANAAAYNPGEDANAAATKGKRKDNRNVPRSQNNKNEKINEGGDEIRKLTEERRNTAKGDRHQLRELSKRIKKCMRDKQKRKDKNSTADPGGKQKHQKYIMHKIWKKENAHPESEK